MNEHAKVNPRPEPTPEQIAAIHLAVDTVRKEVAALSEDEGAALETSAKSTAKHGRAVLRT